MLARLPAADVLLTHSPPEGVNDEPDDHVHSRVASAARVGRAPPAGAGCCTATCCRTRRARCIGRGPTRVVLVRGALPFELVGRGLTPRLCPLSVSAARPRRERSSRVPPSLPLVLLADRRRCARAGGVAAAHRDKGPEVVASGLANPRGLDVTPWGPST